MKLIFFTICAIVTVAVSAVPTEELLKQCAVCDNYVAYLTTNHGQIHNMPMEFDVFASFDYYKNLCAVCNLDEDVENELQQQDELSLDGIWENDDEEEFALSKYMPSHKNTFLDDIRFRLFIKSSRDKIITCMELRNC